VRLLLAYRTVLRIIREIIEYAPEMNRSNFGEVVYVAGNGQSQPSFEMDRDGFSLLATEPQRSAVPPAR
jgi:phage regulator Rha-like protein